MKIWGWVAVTCVAVLAVGASRPCRIVRVEWNYSRPSPEIVFRLYSSSNLTDWKCIAVLPPACRGIVLVPDKNREFFTLTASNTVLEVESEKATR